ncbi:MAG: sugar phosphate isomerase/epimerase [Christensenellaceae bacterium]|jgi:sugar phosphate isomerase/epimerase|nr:sugar phosphate isomerase/epimerase [Christensenellaceae bacterium]
MKIGISTGAFFLKLHTEDTFDVIKSIGAETCEIFLATFSEYTREFGEILKTASAGLDVYSIHAQTMQFEPDLFSASSRLRHDAEQIFTNIAKIAARLGARYYTMHGPARLKRIPYNINYDAISSRLAELDSILGSITDGKCAITYENVHYCFFNTPSFFTTLRDKSKIYACLDIKQAMQSKIDTYDYLDAMRGRLRNVHLCDYTAEGTPAMPGKGIFDFTSFFVKLMAYGYDGPLMLEPYQNNYNTYDELALGLTYLKDCLKQAERRFALDGK